MYKLADKHTIFVDVDNTLILWGSQVEPVVNLSFGQTASIHVPHLEKIKEFKARGHLIVVWSAGGADWAERIVYQLKIEEYVDLIISKPSWFIDDLEATEFMPPHNRIFLEPYPKD